MPQNNKRIILAFDGNLKLIGMFSSYYTAAKASGVSHQVISKACSGSVVAAGNLYWREADIKEYMFDCDDLGILTLLEYDNEHGENRKIYASRNMKKNDIVLESEYINKHKSKNND